MHVHRVGTVTRRDGKLYLFTPFLTFFSSSHEGKQNPVEQCRCVFGVYTGVVDRDGAAALTDLPQQIKTNPNANTLEV